MKAQHLRLTFLISLTLIFLLSVFSSCEYEEILPPEEIPIDTTAPPVSFSLDIIPLFNSSCNTSGCHSLGGVEPDLSPNNAFGELTTKGYLNLDDPVESEFYQWIAGNRRITMPIAGPDPELNRLVLTWITQGAPNN
jgi:hypothetical protein